MAGKYEPATPLTSTLAKAAAAKVKASNVAATTRVQTSTRQRPRDRTSGSAWTCPDCGAPVSNARHIRCDACIAVDPGQTAALRKSRGVAISARKQAEAAWEGACVDPDAWEKTIRPALASVPLLAIMRRLGVSKSSAWSWKVGRTTQSHWRALAALAGVPLPAAAY